jgi:hypothetical protein
VTPFIDSALGKGERVVERVSSIQTFTATLQKGALWLRLSALSELARAPCALSFLPYLSALSPELFLLLINTAREA